MSQEAYPLPCCDLLVRPDAGGVESVPRSFVGDEGCLTDDQSAWYARTRRIMLDSKVGVGVLVVRSVAGEGCHDHPVLGGDVAELDRLEEFGSGHCKAMLVLSEYCLGSLLQKSVPLYMTANPHR